MNERFLALMAIVSFKVMSRNIKRGFICGDPSLSLTRKPDTISDLAIVIWSILPVFIVNIFIFLGQSSLYLQVN